MVEGKTQEATTAAVLGPRMTSPLLTRRALLAGTGQVAILAMLPVGCAPIANAPWADGTFWDDGLGWVDRSGQLWSSFAGD